MAQHKLVADLSYAGLTKLAQEVENYRKDVLVKTDMFAQRLAERGYELARFYVADYDALFTLELINSIEVSKGGEALYYVNANSEHACFVEFGTGYIGRDNPYPYPLPSGVSWEYISGSQIVANKAKGIYGWFYKGKDGKTYFTEGMPARPFMHDTLTTLMMEVTTIAREVFR